VNRYFGHTSLAGYKAPQTTFEALWRQGCGICGNCYKLEFLWKAQVVTGQEARARAPAASANGVVLSKLGRGEGRDCINNRLNATRLRDRGEGVEGE
jgi:hypothetical protein